MTTTKAQGTVTLANGAIREAVAYRVSATVMYRAGNGASRPTRGKIATSFRIDPQQAAWLYEQALAEDAQH